MKTTASMLALGLFAATTAFAQTGSPSTPYGSAAIIDTARSDDPNDDVRLQGSVVQRPMAERDRRMALNVGEVQATHTMPPSNDRFQDGRARVEWTSPQRGTSATGMGPTPGTSGQPGTLQ